MPSGFFGWTNEGRDQGAWLRAKLPGYSQPKCHSAKLVSLLPFSFVTRHGRIADVALMREKE